ncbi:MAG: phosphate propanoyltransferase [Deltaproteobacteria bacterium]|nr:phosphate propanoyltransferase [Deltaproteobacteria bacterium]
MPTVPRPTIPVALSARHAHLSQEHVEALFGKGYHLTPLSDLSQPGQFACRETIEVVGPKRSLPGLRILGPARPNSQVELAFTDGIVLGLNLPVRLSGDTKETPGAHLIGPRGAVKLREGLIVAARHVHCSPDDARRLGLQDRQKVYARFPGPRGLLFDEVLVRIDPNYRTELHLDTDEGNAAGIRSGEAVEIVTSLCRDLCGLAECPIAPGVRDGESQPFCDFTERGDVSFFRH